MLALFASNCDANIQKDRGEWLSEKASLFDAMVMSFDADSTSLTGGALTEEQKAKQKYERFHQKPFQNIKMEVIGLIIMIILIALSVAGGLSGGGSNIPIMLIFFNMEMDVAVPISGFCAVSSTVYRYLANWSVTHPTVEGRSII